MISSGHARQLKKKKSHKPKSSSSKDALEQAVSRHELADGLPWYRGLWPIPKHWKQDKTQCV